MPQTPIALFGALGWSEFLLIFLIILLLFGAKKLPEIARSLGEGIKEFKKSMRDVNDSSGNDKSQDDSKPRG
ncbi:MAG: twin-arginine translocase TatA/TatE family subunit [Candidatus Auribacterota bacterium]|jgi:sec-independent protein translocase protein TatA|uniref:Sec-independent protein translocase protein TatA n=1 Tax=Candidatus Auribacter fodinae TaxID=2093366 RepID=A0A3A4R4L2_9BACT|nr:MAG: twin-arginine translocase TatA/TatE family subunit [Candidatus Auribacter fodinae]